MAGAHDGPGFSLAGIRHFLGFQQGFYMAKARKQTAAQARAALKSAADQLAEKSAELDLHDEDEDAENDVIAELRGMGAGDGYRYRVNKISSKPGEAAGYCATYDAGDLSLDTIREQFGGGKYRIRVVDQGGKYIGNATVEIVGLPKPATPAVAPAAPAQDLSGIAEIIAAMKPAAPDAAAGDRVTTMLLAMMENQGKMFQAMMSRDKGPSITEILALVQNKGGGDKSPVDLLLEGLKLGRELGGDSGGSELDVANKGLDVLGQLIAQKQNEQAPPPQQLLPRALPATATATPAAPAGGQDVGLLQKLNWLRAQTTALVGQAKRQKNPELYAEVMLDNLPPFITAEEILQRLQAPGAVAELAQLNAEVNQHAEWFEDFRQAVVELLTNPPEPEPDPETPAV
jgi:hypothetical protein